MEKKNKMKNNFSNEVIFYLVFGVLTTLVNIVVFMFLSNLLELGTVPANVISWFLSVLFAYFTNRKWVFKSKGDNVFKEGVAFFSGRIFTGVLDTAVMFVSVDIMGWNNLLMKIVSNIVVIVLNYLISKFLVFRRKP